MTAEEDRQRAVNLKEQAAAALIAARTAMNSAMHATADFDRLIEARLDEAGSLATPARLAHESEQAGRLTDNPAVRDNATDDVRRALQSAGLTTDQLDGRLQRDLGQLEQIGDDLERSSRALGHAKSFVDELEQLPVERDEATGEPTPEAAEQLRQTSILRQRLSSTERAVGTAADGVKGTQTQFKAARETARVLTQSSMNVDTSGRTSNSIDDTRAEIGGNLQTARQSLNGANQDLTAARPATEEAAWRSADLANAARAGLNPTKPSAQRTPAGSSQSDLRHRLDGPAPDSTRER
jgi:hypothetical protein